MENPDKILFFQETVLQHIVAVARAHEKEIEKKQEQPVFAKPAPKDWISELRFAGAL